MVDPVDVISYTDLASHFVWLSESDIKFDSALDLTPSLPATGLNKLCRFLMAGTTGIVW